MGKWQQTLKVCAVVGILTYAKRPMNDAPLTLFTIGHSTRPICAFTDLLHRNGVETLIDVRRFAGSRKNPQYNPEALRSALAAIGIEYVPMPELGGRRRARADSHNTAWRNEAFRGYADYMQTPEFAAAIERLLERARRQRVAIMCAESVWWRCHRGLIADYLKVRGIDVRHIMGNGEPEMHPYTSAASIRNGQLSYAPDDLFNAQGAQP